MALNAPFLFEDSDLSGLPVANPGGGLPWNNNGFLSVGDSEFPVIDSAAVIAALGYIPADDADVVHNTGAEDISGVKTFFSEPVVPSLAFGAGFKFDIHNAAIEAISTNGLQLSTLGVSDLDGGAYLRNDLDLGVSIFQHDGVTLGSLTAGAGMFSNAVSVAAGGLFVTSGTVRVPSNTYIQSSEPQNRLYFAANNQTYFISPAQGFFFQTPLGDVASISNAGEIASKSAKIGDLASGFVTATQFGQLIGEQIGIGKSWSLVSVGGTYPQGLLLSNVAMVRWSNSVNYDTGYDIGLVRNAAGVLEINNGTLSILRDLKLRAILATGNSGFGGATSPAYPVVVKGECDTAALGPLYIVSAGGNIGCGFVLDATSSGGNKFSLFAGGSVAGVAGGWGMYNASTTQFVFVGTAAGNLGIGNITGPLSKLSVVGNLSVGTNVAAPTNGLAVSGDTSLLGSLTLAELVAPAAPAANKGVLYLEDNGAGKTKLMIRFATGAAQQIAIEP